MLSFFLGFELIKEEEHVLETFINETTGGRGSNMSKNDFESLMSSSVVPKEFVGEEYERNQKEALLKLARCLKKKGRKLMSEIVKYQTKAEHDDENICVRNLKHFLHTVGNLTTYEMQQVIYTLDNHHKYFVDVVRLSTAMPSEEEVDASTSKAK